MVNTLSVMKTHKDRMFRLLFSDRRCLLELYNALRGSDYDDPEALEINTLDNILFMGMKNDLSFLIDNRLSLFEHQSTFNPNMPLRGLLYLTDLIRIHIEKSHQSQHSSTRIPIPTPYYVVFYNGTKEQPDLQILKLSDSYTVIDETEPPCLEMTALMLNINLGHNQELMERCKSLSDYAHFVALIRQHKAEGFDLADAINLAIDQCLQRDILTEFLKKSRSEVMKMLWYEYNEEDHISNEKELSYAEGEARGLAKGEARGLAKGADYNVPIDVDTLRRRVP